MITSIYNTTPPIFISMTGLLCCPSGCEPLLHRSPIVLVIIANSTALSSKTFMWDFRSSMNYSPLFSHLDDLFFSLVKMNLSLLLFKMVEKLKIYYCTESNFLSTITVPTLSPGKWWLSSRKSCGKLISESADAEDSNSGRVLEKLLLL